MAKAPKKAAVKINRSAKTGKFVTKNFAKKHPGTTVAETQKKILTAIDFFPGQV